MATSTRFLVHRRARAHPPPLPAGELLVAAPPAVAWAAPAAAAWLQYLVPLVGGAGSLVFLLAVPGPRHPLLVAAVAGTAVASLALGAGLRLAERRSARRARRRERSRYLAHLAQVGEAADRLAAAQLAAAEHLHPDPARLWALACQAERLWERRPADNDFLTVRVGRGPVPLAPVTVPLRRLGVLSLTGPRDHARALARALLCQLAAFHARHLTSPASASSGSRRLRVAGPSLTPELELGSWVPASSPPAQQAGASGRLHGRFTSPSHSGRRTPRAWRGCGRHSGHDP